MQDLYSGKLHREFHYGPDPVTSEEPQAQEGKTFHRNFENFLQKFTPKNFIIPDPRNNEIETNHGDRVKRSNNKKPSPPPSQFQHLGPSKNRYTLLHDEF